jgi:hypothetical protein
MQNHSKGKGDSALKRSALSAIFIAIVFVLHNFVTFILHIGLSEPGISPAPKLRNSNYSTNNSFLNEEIYDNYPALYKNKVCILMPIAVAPVYDNWTFMQETQQIRTVLRSLNDTSETSNYTYHVYIGYRAGDKWFDPSTLTDLSDWILANLPALRLETPRHDMLQSVDSADTTNSLAHSAFMDNCEFLYATDAHTEPLTAWTTAFITALHALSPPMHGVVAPSCQGDGCRPFASNFIHRSHLERLRAHHPPELPSELVAAWLSSVYGPANARVLPHVHVRSTLLHTRTERTQRLLDRLVDEGRASLAQSAKPKLIAYSLYGNDPRYTGGAVANARLAAAHYPGWRDCFREFQENDGEDDDRGQFVGL